uniref:Uncharacterized protein n=1 Tax=Cucumis melo TaxID=3656 RepID=A0A9I9EB88_CUCME
MGQSHTLDILSMQQSHYMLLNLTRNFRVLESLVDYGLRRGNNRLFIFNGSDSFQRQNYERGRFLFSENRREVVYSSFLLDTRYIEKNQSFIPFLTTIYTYSIWILLFSFEF